MKFRTKLSLKSSKIKIDHNDPILLVGSCFSSSIGEKLTSSKFKTLVNPYGVLYHPMPILRNLINSIKAVSVDDQFMINRGSLWYHYDFHGDVRAGTKKDLKLKIKTLHEKVADFLTNTRFLIVTLGTAFYFRHKHLDTIVANCHKQPNELFHRDLSSVNEVKEIIKKLVVEVSLFNPKIDIIFTVSPVRHLRDGIIDNNRSKANLISAVHDIAEQFEEVHYFPAYELLMDDLRDYRFYNEDLVHPNKMAIDYIWNQFESGFISERSIGLNQEINQLMQAFNHRPFEPDSKEYRDFLIKLKDRMVEFESKYRIALEPEMNLLNQKISLFDKGN